MANLTMIRARNIAVSMKDVLFPYMAIEILENVYGKKLEIMRPETIADKVWQLCMQNGYESEDNDIIQAVNDYIYDDNC